MYKMNKGIRFSSAWMIRLRELHFLLKRMFPSQNWKVQTPQFNFVFWVNSKESTNRHKGNTNIINSNKSVRKFNIDEVFTRYFTSTSPLHVVILLSTQYAQLQRHHKALCNIASTDYSIQLVSLIGKASICDRQKVYNAHRQHCSPE